MPKSKRGGVDPFGWKSGAGHLMHARAARVVDMSTYLRLKEEGITSQKMQVALGCSGATVWHLNRGTHWQQQPDRVREHNKRFGGNIAPLTGVPTERDLVDRGYIRRGKLRAVRPEISEPAQQALAALGHDVESAGRMADHLSAVGGMLAPGVMSTSEVLGGLENALHFALKLWTPDFLAKAAPRDLSSITSMLIEKRQLLKGEPTVITRQEQRADLAEFARRLLAECERRGVSLSKEEPVLIEGKAG